MMRGNSLAGSLAFAGIVALAAIPWTMVAVPVLWPALAVGLYAVAAVAAYAVWIAPTWRRGLVAGSLAGGLAALAAFLSSSLVETVLGAALALAVARGGVLYRSSAARTLAIEGGLLLAGLLFARSLAGATSLGVGMGFWAFFLVQSLYFLIGGVRERPAEKSARDPFIRAREKALAILGEG